MRILSIFAFIMVVCFMQSQVYPQEKSFDVLEKEFFDQYIHFFPEDGTELGYHSVDGLFSDYTASSIRKQTKFYTRWNSVLEDVIKNRTLTNKDLIDAEMMRSITKYMLHWLNNKQYLGHIALSLSPRKVISSQQTRAGNNLKRWQDIKKRLDAIPVYLQTQEFNLSNGKKLGKRPNIYAYNDVLKSFDEDSSFFDSLSQRAVQSLYVGSMPSRVKKFLKSFSISCKEANKAYLNHMKWIKTNVQTDSNFSMGSKEYTRHLREVFNIGSTPEELVTVAQKELSNMLNELGLLLHTTDPISTGIRLRKLRSLSGKIPETSGSLSSKDTVFAFYRSLSEKVKKFARINHLFGDLDDNNFSIIEMPKGMSGNPPAANWPAQLKDPLSKSYFAIDLTRSIPLQRASVMQIHEGIPGHSSQSRYWQKIFGPDPSPVLFLQISDEANVITGYWGMSLNVEGYAHYCERLMLDRGFFADTLERVEAIAAQTLRCVRVIIDCGLHAQGMTVAAAANYLYTYGLEEPTVESALEQVERRYALYPTQAMTYMIGRMQIQDIRNEWLKENPTSTLAAFHDIFMSFGPIPPEQIKKHILNKLSSTEN